MVRHTLKVWLAPYEHLASGAKTWEARKDDRGGYAVGDVLELVAFNHLVQQFDNSKPRLLFRVTHVQTMGMAEGYVGLSLKRVSHRDLEAS